MFVLMDSFGDVVSGSSTAPLVRFGRLPVVVLVVGGHTNLCEITTSKTMKQFYSIVGVIVFCVQFTKWLYHIVWPALIVALCDELPGAENTHNWARVPKNTTKFLDSPIMANACGGHILGAVPRSPSTTHKTHQIGQGGQLQIA